jgi:outer membrane protein assembly factor BamD
MLLSGIALTSAPAEAGKKRDAALSAEQLYDRGLRAMQRGYYTKSLESFNRVRNFHRDDPISIKAQLAIADVYFKKGDLEQARFAYEEFAAYHPRHENLDYVTYRIGLSIFRRAPRFAGRDQTATRGAVNAWTGFETRFPESEHVESVTKHRERGRDRLAAKELHIAAFYADREAWGAVRGRAERMIRRYADAPQRAEALRMLGEAQHRWGLTSEALQTRETLAQSLPNSPALRRLDRVLASPAGAPPEDEIFVRPYRIRGVSPLTGAAY